MNRAELSLIHHYEVGWRSGPPLLLLHGTGGDEHSLLSFARSVAPDRTTLSPRGNVMEDGKARFFRRFAEGVLDEEDVRRRAHELADFIEAARSVYQIAAPIAIGFSNGANIAAALLLLRPETLAGAALLRPMMPLSEPPRSALAGKSVLIVSADNDPIIPAGHEQRLIARLNESGAHVQTERLVEGGHDLSSADEAIVRSWIAR